MPTNVVILQGDITQLKVDTIVPGDRIGTRESYRTALRNAAERHARSIAFPDGPRAIPNGSNALPDGSSAFPDGPPADRPHSGRDAALIALTEVRDFVATHPGTFSEIIFACWDTENYHLYKEILGGENRMIDIPT
jgi:O-acetyl-ADP-ribose deacetylase (regulator of RNase III)